MSVKNEDAKLCRITLPDGSDEWEDFLYQNQIDDYANRGFIVEILN